MDNSEENHRYSSEMMLYLYYWLFSIQLIYLTMNPPLSQPPVLHQAEETVLPLDATSKLEGRWTHQEHLKFLNAIIRYGKDWKKVQIQVSNRTGPQVRSHAQKYFLKINKIIKDRKKIKGKKMPDITDTELQLKQYFSTNRFTLQTPKEIIELLKIEKVGIKKLIQENYNGKQLRNIQQLLAPTIKSEKIKNPKTKQSCPSAQVLESIQNQVDETVEDFSFLATIFRKNQEFFFKGGPFSAFIDFKGDSKKEKITIDEQETSGHRKHSFTQFDGEIIEH